MNPNAGLPIMVYKYRSWKDDFHKRCLLENELYFPSPQEINDPFDFRIFVDFSLLDTDEKRIQYIEKAFSMHDNAGAITGFKSLEDAKNQNLILLRYEPEKIQKYFNNLEESKNIRFRILCLSHIWDSILMWSHYGDQHQGYCLGFETQSFLEANLGLCASVKYQEEYPTINPLGLGEIESILYRTICKAKEWYYEKEFRIVQILNKEERVSSKPVIFKEARLKEVILGLNIKYDHALEIGTICKKRKIPLFKIEKVPKKFELTRVRIEY